MLVYVGYNLHKYILVRDLEKVAMTLTLQTLYFTAERPLADFQGDSAPNIGQIFWEIAISVFNGSDDFPEESKDKRMLGTTMIVELMQPRVYISMSPSL